MGGRMESSTGTNTLITPGTENGVLTTRRRAAVVQVQRLLGVAERRACRVLEQPRSSQRFVPRGPERDRALSDRLVALSRRYPRYGYRRIWALLRRQGWRVNRKRVQRLWRHEGLRVPQVQRKRQRLGRSENGCRRCRFRCTCGTRSPSCRQ